MEYGVLLQSFKNNVIWIISQYKINNNINQGLNKRESNFSSEMLDAIVEHSAFAVTNAAISKQYMSEFYKVCTQIDIVEEYGEVWSNK